jgi:hypothetical protein
MLLFIIVAMLFIYFLAHSLLLFFSFALLFIMYKLFWRTNEPKVIFLGLLLFWFSIIVKVFYADIVGVSYESLSISPLILESTFISLISLLVFSIGLHLTSRSIEKSIYISYSDNFNYKTNKVIILYIAATLISLILNGVLFVFPAFSQLFNAFFLFKLGLLFLLIHNVYSDKKKVWIVVLIIAFELLLSLVSFFSSFKDILITVAIVFSFYPIKFRLSQLIRNAIFIVFTIFVMLIWQTIKSEYREYLNKGSRTQTIQVSSSEAIGKVWELVQEANPFSRDNDIIYQSIDRLSYIEFFSQAMVRVPSEIPYENGKLWINNITHILTPRFFYNDKKAIDDSEMVNTYCMRQVATMKEGTSFSLGFIAESYIDFGPYFMFIPIFFIGCLLGLAYRLVISKSLNFIWGFSFVTPLWINIYCTGTPGTKILGWIVVYLILFYILNRFVIKKVDLYLKS